MDRTVGPEENKVTWAALMGYADRLSVGAGESIEFKVDCKAPSFGAEVVRLFGGGVPGAGPAIAEQVMPAGLKASYPGRTQGVVMGSYCASDVMVPLTLAAVGLAAWICPTLLEPGRVNAVISIGSADGDRGLTLAATPTGCALLATDGECLAETGVALIEREWCFVSATVDLAGVLTLTQAPRRRPVVTRTATTAALGDLSGTPIDQVLVGARLRRGVPTAVFNGRLARPVLSTTAWDGSVTSGLIAGTGAADLLPHDSLCALDFTGDQARNTLPDLGGLTSEGTLVNLPSRAVPGPFWRGSETDFRLRPDEYDAIHFHDDDMVDAAWETDVALTVPGDWASGVYALRMRVPGCQDYIPFVVSPTAAAEPAPVLLVLPTWTYLAYANWRSYAADVEARADSYGESREPDPRDVWLMRHPELGKSLYDVHRDGSGVIYSSRLRPIVSLRPDYFSPTANGLRHFGQDLEIVRWLEARGQAFDVATDEDLEREGAHLLGRHRVVLTGSHPEYCSARMLDAYEQHVRSGGRLMYLGGNGFYQVTAQHPHCDGVIEVRRGQSGVTPWTSEPGEEHLASTGEPGGLWRLRGRHPQRLAGIGFTAQCFDEASPYRRTEASHYRSVDWVFRGVDNEVFGDIGGGLGGAAGDELDRADISLGTPVHTVVLASSFGHSSRALLVPEEADRSPSAIPLSAAGSDKLRADLVIIEHEGGGAVFSVGSISWCGAMSHADGDNDVSRITGNVLDAFLGARRPLDTDDPWHRAQPTSS